MWKGVLTLMTRSLRVDDRSAKTHLLRLVFVLLIYFFLWYAQSLSLVFGAPGRMFYSMMSTINFIFIALAGLSYFSTAITEEKEEQTLGLLRMAGVPVLAILLGKQTPRLVNAALLLTAQFPFTLLAVTLGGVTLHQVAAAYCALLAYLLATAALGLLISVVSLRSNSASTRMLMLTIAFLIGPWLLSMVLSVLVTAGYLSESGGFAIVCQTGLGWLHEMSAWQRLTTIVATGFAEPLVGFQVVSNLLAAGLFFLLSWALFERCNANEHSAAPQRSAPSHRKKYLALINTTRAWKHALVWKDFYFCAGGMTMLIAKFVLYGLLVGIIAYSFITFNPDGFEPESVGGLTMGFSLFAIVAELSLYASRYYRDEIKWQTLSTLSMLPESISSVAYAKTVGCIVGLAPALFYFCVGAIMCPAGLSDFLTEALTEVGGWVAISLFVLFLHVIVYFTLHLAWGALPLAFVTVVLGYFMLLLLTFSLFRFDFDGPNVIILLTAIAATAVLHWAIGARLRNLSSK